MRQEYLFFSSVECDANLRYCGYEDTTADFSSLPIIRDCYLLHYVSCGEGYYTTRGKTYHLTAGDMFCIFPKEIVFYYAEKENPWSFYWFSFNGRKALEFSSRMGFSILSPVQHIVPGNSIPELMDALLQTCLDSVQPRDFTLLYHLYLLFSEIEHSYTLTGNKPAPQKSSAVYIEKAIQFITYNYHRSITIGEISSYLGLDRTYFSKLFGRIQGIPPQKYLLKFRLEKSLPLLRETNLSIDEIGHAVGVENIPYYSRAFKLHMGVSPSAYRNSLKSKTAE